MQSSDADGHEIAALETGVWSWSWSWSRARSYLHSSRTSLPPHPSSVAMQARWFMRHPPDSAASTRFGRLCFAWLCLCLALLHFCFTLVYSPSVANLPILGFPRLCFSGPGQRGVCVIRLGSLASWPTKLFAFSHFPATHANLSSWQTSLAISSSSGDLPSWSRTIRKNLVKL